MNAMRNYFLVIRNENKNTVDIFRFSNMGAALKEQEDLEKKYQNYEVILCCADDLEELLNVYTEYRPTNWQDLVKRDKERIIQ
jgi:hypothetical protein